MHSPSLSRIGLILLAGGGSRRLGTPKQLLADGAGRTLVRRAAEAALESACRPVVVVAGASAEAVQRELADLPLTLIINAAWETGLASSLKAGLNTLLDTNPPDAAIVDAVLVMLCDQPNVSSSLLNSLIAAYTGTGHQIAACEYGGALGVPAVFGQTLFPALLALTGDEGARRVIKRYAGPVTRIPFPEGAFDIDTPQDALKLSAS
jgi:molybdenum cofactor cytidylyltransferase